MEVNWRRIYESGEEVREDVVRVEISGGRDGGKDCKRLKGGVSRGNVWGLE